MKRMLVVFVLLLAVSGGAHSNSSKAYVGLFSDENHSAMSA